MRYVILLLAGCAHTAPALRCAATTDAEMLRGVALAEATGATTFALIEKETRLTVDESAPVVMTRVIRYAFKNDETIAIARSVTCAPLDDCKRTLSVVTSSHERTLEIEGGFVIDAAGCASRDEP